MSEIEDLAGQTFEQLYIIEFYRKIEGRPFWLCKCDCGRSPDFPVRSDSLKSGVTNSCKICGKERKGLASFQDLTGMIFGELTVLKRDEDYISPKGYHLTKWLCRCVCGNQISIIPKGLLKGVRTFCNHKNHIKIKIREEVESYGYIFIDEYLDRNYRMVLIQDKIGYKYDVQLASLRNDSELEKFCKNNPYTLENISLWLKLNNKSYVLCKENEFKNSTSKLYFICDVCKEVFNSGWNSIQQGQGCSVCKGKQVVYKTSLAYLRPDLAKEWSEENEISSEDVTCGSHFMAKWQCCYCGFLFPAKVKNRAINGTGCPSCASPKGEETISELFNSWNFVVGKDFIPQARFKGCKNKKLLPFDFYLPDYNLCIEYHGSQHYKAVDFFGGERAFKDQQKRDKIKVKYCKDNNISLLIIPYWEFENMEKILSENLFD